MPKRPDFTTKLSPVPTSKTNSYGLNYVNYGNRAGVYVEEISTGTSRRKPKSSWIDPTTYTFTRREWQGCTGKAKYMPWGVPTTQSGSIWTGCVGTVPGDSITLFDLPNWVVDPLYSQSLAMQDDGLRGAALIAALNKLKTSKVDLGVAYAERKQTTRLVGDTASRIGQSFMALASGRTRHAMNILGISSRRGQPRGSNVPQKWLEIQYGWKPLLSDVFGACDSLATRDKDDWRITAKATRSTRVEKASEFGARTDKWGKRSVACEKSVFVRIDCTPANELMISLASLGVLNPLAIAWERTYLSFVVDWFLPIGNWLDSLDALVGYSVRGSSSSLWVKSEWTSSGIGVQSWYNSGAKRTEKVENSWTGGMKLKYLNRQVGVAGTIPPFPRPKDPRSLGHMANGLALLAGAFGRKR